MMDIYKKYPRELLMTHILSLDNIADELIVASDLDDKDKLMENIDALRYLVTMLLHLYGKQDNSKLCQRIA